MLAQNETVVKTRNKILGKNIKVYKNDTLINTYTTNNLGVFVTAPLLVDSFNINIRCEYEGDNNYTSTSETQVINIYPMVIDLYSNTDILYSTSDSITITASVEDSTGQDVNIPNKNVIFIASDGENTNIDAQDLYSENNAFECSEYGTTLDFSPSLDDNIYVSYVINDIPQTFEFSTDAVESGSSYLVLGIYDETNLISSTNIDSNVFLNSNSSYKIKFLPHQSCIIYEDNISVGTINLDPHSQYQLGFCVNDNFTIENFKINSILYTGTTNNYGLCEYNYNLLSQALNIEARIDSTTSNTITVYGPTIQSSSSISYSDFSVTSGSGSIASASNNGVVFEVDEFDTSMEVTADLNNYDETIMVQIDDFNMTQTQPYGINIEIGLSDGDSRDMLFIAEYDIDSITAPLYLYFGDTDILLIDATDTSINTSLRTISTPTSLVIIIHDYHNVEDDEPETIAETSSIYFGEISYSTYDPTEMM